MPDRTARQAAESLFDRTQRRDAEITDAMKQERARHEAVLRNMYRLRELRRLCEAKDGQKNTA